MAATFLSRNSNFIYNFEITHSVATYLKNTFQFNKKSFLIYIFKHCYDCYNGYLIDILSQNELIFKTHYVVCWQDFFRNK